MLVVEDEFLIASLVEDMLADLGCEVVGPEGALAAAMKLAREEAIDLAVLDVTIRGGQVFPVAEILLERGVPFILASGYGDLALPDAFRGGPRLTKPFNAAELERALHAARAVAGWPPGSPDAH
ncbi:MAG TPA: response regulator [Caulobacteraceae bacterium]